MRCSMSIVYYAFALAIVCVDVEAVKKKLIDEINICKRNDPDLTKCYCTNFNTILPKLKDGVPAMNVIPIDPVIVENIKMDFPQTKSIKLAADLFKVNVIGMSRAKASVCKAIMTSDGIQLYFEIYFPEIVLKSLYKAKGNFLLLNINGDGDFHGEFGDMIVKAVWNSTRYMKNNKEHLRFTADIVNITMEKMQIHFNNLLGRNSTELNDNINYTINENIDLLYDEIKPVILETVRGISLKIVNDFYDVFPFDVLYPKE